MLATDPENWELYRLLADVHRRLGDAAEAGRWGYLTDNVAEEELEAFEEAHPQPWIRLQLLGWQGDPEALPSSAGRARLVALRKEAMEATIPTQRRPQESGHPVVPSRPTIPSQRQPVGWAPEISSRQRMPLFASPGADDTPVTEKSEKTTSSSKGKKARPLFHAIRTYAILLLLILVGSAGSVVAVGGIRALFGVKNWSAPIKALLSEIARALTGS